MSVIDKLRKRVADTTTRRDGVITVINGPPCSCGECRASEAQEILNAYAAACSEGVAAERARVVAWLRAEAAMVGEAGGGERLRLLAFTFERVEHVPEGV